MHAPEAVDYHYWFNITNSKGEEEQQNHVDFDFDHYLNTVAYEEVLGG